MAHLADAAHPNTGTTFSTEPRTLRVTIEPPNVASSQALHARHRTYEEVARRAGLDRRTVKAYVTSGR